ncbi:MAG: agmatinase [Candidatus Pseudothioglobus sp.]
MSIDDFEDMKTDQAFTKKSLYGRANEMTYGGALSFLRRKYTKDLTGVDIAVSGIPYDAATSFRPGARFGPKAIREASVQLAELLAFPDGIDPFKTLAVTDYGDCELDYGFHGNIVSEIESHAKTILDSGAEMLTFGGDHFVTYPLLRAYAEKYGPIALVHFDAHTDTWPDEDGRLDHGTMFSRAIKENLIDTEHSIQIGIRTHNSNTKLDAPWVHENGINKVINKIIDVVKDRPAYMTFDIDGLDPAYAPGTGTPVSGGLTSAQALGIIRGLEKINFIGADVVEVAPAYDHADITAIAAATIAHDYLVLRAKQKKNEK